MSSLLMACSDHYLELNSLTDIAESNFWQTEKDAQLGINGVYQALQARVLYSGNLNGVTGMPSHDSFSDNSYNFWKNQGAGFFVEGTLDESAGIFNTFWVANYTGIARSNQAIEKISNMTEAQISTAAKNSYLGQAYFLRSLFNYNLAVYFENAPLITKVQELEESYVPKNNQREILDQIIADLTLAQGMLPVSHPAALYGYATKGAGLGLLARVYMFDKQYQKAAEAAKAVIDLGVYQLYPDYAQLFTEAGEQSKEIVFSVRFLQGAAHNNGEMFSGTFAGAPKIDEQPMPNLVNDYYATDGRPINQSPLYNPKNKKENRDPRLLASVYFQGDVFLTNPRTEFRGNTVTSFGLKKYIRNGPSAAGIPTNQEGSQDFYVIRYADILLMRAEALIELGETSQPDVNSTINLVRARVGMPTVQAVEGTGLGQAALREIVRHERRVELAFEGLRFADLKRWGKMQEAYNRMVADKITGYNPQYRAKRSETFPIPLSDLDANKNLKQNSEWE